MSTSKDMFEGNTASDLDWWEIFYVCIWGVSDIFAIKKILDLKRPDEVMSATNKIQNK